MGNENPTNEGDEKEDLRASSYSLTGTKREEKKDNLRSFEGDNKKADLEIERGGFSIPSCKIQMDDDEM